MTIDPLNAIPHYDLATTFFARRPRHEPGPERSRTIYLIDGVEPPEWQESQLLDVSRAGIKLGATHDLAKGRSLHVVVQAADGKRLLERTCLVRWCKKEGDATYPWHLGVEFPEPLEWEILGELFLHGVLNTGHAS